MLGSDAWHGGFWNKSGGHINPLALSRGLARVVLDHGGKDLCALAGNELHAEADRWMVKTPRARSVAAR